MVNKNINFSKYIHIIDISQFESAHILLELNKKDNKQVNLGRPKKKRKGFALVYEKEKKRERRTVPGMLKGMRHTYPKREKKSRGN